MTPQHHEESVTRMKILVDWVAAALGLGTIAGLVNILVGLLSALWLAYQLYVAVRYELPIKRARLKAVRAGLRDPQPSDRAPLS